MIRILNNRSSPAYKNTFINNLAPYIYANRRRGAPKQDWAKYTLKESWEKIRWDTNISHLEYTNNNPQMEETIREWARNQDTSLD